MGNKTKTWKREISLVCIVFLGYLAVTDRVKALEILAFPVFIFAGASYGMDWARKQTDLVKNDVTSPKP